MGRKDKKREVSFLRKRKTKKHDGMFGSKKRKINSDICQPGTSADPVNKDYLPTDCRLTVLENVTSVTLATDHGQPNLDSLSNTGLVTAHASNELPEKQLNPKSRDENEELELNNDASTARQPSSELQTYKRQNRKLGYTKSQKPKPDKKDYDAAERLIIDKEYFFENLKNISNHAPQFGCTLLNLQITGETKMGLNSKLKLSCDMCNASFTIQTTNPHPSQNVDINTAAVSGITSTGIGLEQFQGLCAAMNLPMLSEQVYKKKHDEICQHWEKTAQEAMAAAAERERLAAIKEGRVNKDGIAIIDVIADGCWSKRSYKNNYSALSGAAAIVGRKFKEVIYLGVKNKFCCICARAQNKQEPVKEHTCYKNYSGSSSGMEAEIIAEAFKHSVEMYNVIFGRLVADGDSSTYARILEERPYKDITVEKIECRNHILRNMCNKLVYVSKDTKYPLAMRKMLTTQRILAIRKVICSAIKNHKNGTAELGVRINSLFVDISNAYNHAFGHHSDCLDHYCSSEKQNEDLVPKVRGTVFWAKVQYIVGSVASHSRSLINDCDSNAVEQFNSIIAKFVGGKRTNLVQRQTYQSRCAAAVVSFNTKSPLYNVQKSLLGKSPKSKTKAFENKRKKKNEWRQKNKKVRKLPFTKALTSVATVTDKHYGTDSCQKPDMDEETYELSKRSFLRNLERTEIERVQIERATVLQRDSSEWLELRRNLLTASNFGKIINRRSTTSASIVKALLYKSNISSVASIKHGVDNESIALTQLANQEKVEISPCGLFIDNEIPFLAATPDGLIGNDTIVEIKCPSSAFNMPIEEAVEKKKVKFWTLHDKKLKINKSHPWFYQVQGQLHVSKRKKCIFGVWSGENRKVTVEKIYRDDEFWEKKMITKLTEFYMDHLLPELVDPRQTRNMPLRQPIYPKKRQLTEPSDAGPSKLTCMQFCPDVISSVSANSGSSEEEHILSIAEY